MSSFTMFFTVYLVLLGGAVEWGRRIEDNVSDSCTCLEDFRVGEFNSVRKICVIATRVR